MILKIMYDDRELPRQYEEYIGEVNAIRFYYHGLTYSKGKEKAKEEFDYEIDYEDEGDISEIYLLNDEGKTIKAIRDVLPMPEKSVESRLGKLSNPKSKNKGEGIGVMHETKISSC